MISVVISPVAGGGTFRKAQANGMATDAQMIRVTQLAVVNLVPV